MNLSSDDIGLKSKWNNKKTSRLTEKPFFQYHIRFYEITFGCIRWFLRFCSTDFRKYKNDKAFKTTGINKIHFKCDCINGFFVICIRGSILCSFAVSSPPGHQIYKEYTIKLFKKINKPVLFHKTFCLEDNDHKPADFNGETIGFTCQLFQI